MSKLKNYCLNITDGEHGSIIDDPDGEYYFLNNNNITEDGIVINPNDRRMSKKEFERINKRTQLSTNDVVIATCGTLGKTQVITDTSINYDFSRSVGIIKTDPQKLLPLFLHYYFKNPHTQKRIERIAEGAVQKHFYIGAMEDFEVEIPDIGIQKDIISAISKIDGKISNNKSICSDLESMAKLLYDYWFVQFDFPDENGKPYKSSGGKMVWNEELKREIPDGWEVSTLKGKYDIKRGISYTSKDIESGDGTPMINLACIDIKRNYRDGEIKYYNGNVTPENLLSPNDLLIACTDLTRNADIVGSPILTPNDGNTYTFSMDIAKLIPNEAELNPIYLYMALRTEYYHKYIKRWASGTNVLHLDLTGLDWYKMWFPPKALQDRFADAIISFEERKHKTMVENQELASLRDFLLPMLMNGQVKVKKEDDNE